MKNGKAVLVSHVQAGFYYKINFVLAGGGFLYYHFLQENETLPYINTVYSFSCAICFLIGWRFSNSHIKHLYLHNCGKKVTVELHTFFSLWKVWRTLDIK